MARHTSTRRPRPLDPSSLHALAIRYVGRFATSEAKLNDYLARKVTERGWADDTLPPIAEIVARCVMAGYVDDTVFAEARARSLARRGYGHRRVEGALHQAGIARTITEALRPDETGAFVSAENFARRRRIGQFGTVPADRDTVRRQFAAMLRAGHSVQHAKYFVQGAPDGDESTEF